MDGRIKPGHDDRELPLQHLDHRHHVGVAQALGFGLLEVGRNHLGDRGVGLAGGGQHQAEVFGHMFEREGRGIVSGFQGAGLHGQDR